MILKIRPEKFEIMVFSSRPCKDLVVAHGMVWHFSSKLTKKLLIFHIFSLESWIRHEMQSLLNFSKIFLEIVLNVVK